jgi:5-methylcytosine-specific restriction enzyme subunit McrC
VNGCQQLFKRGLDRNYQEVSQEYPGIKGKIDFSASLNKNLFEKGRAVCIFDQFEYNIIHNQILKATLKRILLIKKLDKKIRTDVLNCYWKFQEIDDIKIQLHHFSQVRIHKNNAFYDLLIRICRLVVECTVLDEQEGKFYFKEFLGNEKAMAALFESFVRNFYIKELTDFKVGREDIKWSAVPLDNGTLDLLPKMQTDVSIERKNKKIIVDAKYYKETLAVHYETEKFRSGNLYQLYSYLRNVELDLSNPLNASCEGILVYPTVQRELNESFQMGNHVVRIMTVDLSQDWRSIDKRLKEIIQGD